MSYASQNAFDGSTACIGDTVVVMTGEGLASAIIDGIIPGASDDVTMWVHREQRSRNNFTFTACANAAAIEAMSENQWTWPVNV